MTVAVLFGVAVVTSQLAAAVRHQARRAEAQAARSATIANLAGRLLACTGEAEASGTATTELSTVFGCNVVLLTGGGSQPRAVAGAPALLPLTPGDLATAALVLESGERAGRGVDRAVPTEWQFHPVRGAGGVIGAVGLARDDGMPAVARDQLPLLDSLLDQLALALDRARLEREALAFTRDRDRDRVRAALLSSIGQDLTPAVTAMGANLAALRREGGGDPATLGRLATEAAKLERYLADLTELEPGTDRPPLTIGDVEIDLFHRAVTRAGAPVHLAPREFAVLAELAKHPGRVLTHAHLLRTAWGPAQETQVDYLRVAVRGLRQKLERDPAKPTLIVNEPAVGYRLAIETRGT